MGTYITQPPADFVISVTRDADCMFTVARTDVDRNPVDWNATVQMAIDVADPLVTNAPVPTVIEATVTADQAVFLLHAELCNAVSGITAWRMFMIVATTNPTGTLTRPLMVGSFERDDGG